MISNESVVVSLRPLQLFHDVFAVRGVNRQGEDGAHHSHAFFVVFARRDGFLGVRQVHHGQDSSDANLGETNLLVLSQVHLSEKQTEDETHQHDGAPVQLRVFDGGSLPFHIRYGRQKVSRDHLKEKREASESHAEETLRRGRRRFVPNRARRQARG